MPVTAGFVVKLRKANSLFYDGTVNFVQSLMSYGGALLDTGVMIAPSGTSL